MWSSTQRLTLGLESPIVTGALAVMALSWLLHLSASLLERRNRVAPVLLLFGAILACLIIIVLTQSRGSLLAAFALLGGIAVFPRWISAKEPERSRGFALGLSAVLCCLVLVGDARGRVSPEFVGRDLSVANRLMIWRQAPDALLAAPFEGIGWGQSGEFISQWLMPDSNQHIYTNVFNNFLQIAIEKGFGALFFYCFGLASVLFACHAIQSRLRYIARAAGGAIAAFSVCSLTTAFLKLEIVECFLVLNLTVVILVYSCVGSPMWGKVLLRGFVIGIAATAVCAGYALLFRSKDVQIKVCSDAAVKILRHSPERVQPLFSKVAVLVDPQLTGRLHGRVIRKWMEELDLGEVYVPHPRRAVPMESLRQYPIFLLIGGSSRFFGDLNSDGVPKRWIFLHPVTKPPAAANGDGWTILLPSFDQYSVNETWRALSGARVYKTEGLGNSDLDVRFDHRPR